MLRIIHERLRPSPLQVMGLTLAEARDRLDYWESLGCRELESTCKDGEGFTVRCVRPGPGS